MEIGDHVLDKKTGFQDRHTLSDKWDDVSYVVVKKPCIDVPVYEVESVLDCAIKKTLHRNMLLPLRKLSKTSVYKPVENMPNVTTNENTNVHKSDSDGSNESDEDPQSTMRRSKRLTKPIDRFAGESNICGKRNP